MVAAIAQKAIDASDKAWTAGALLSSLLTKRPYKIADASIIAIVRESA